MFEPVGFCGDAFGIIGIWDKKFFSPKGSHHIIKKEELNIVRVSNMFSVFSFFRFSGCLPALMEFFSIHVITLKPESTSKHCFDETVL